MGWFIHAQGLMKVESEKVYDIFIIGTDEVEGLMAAGDACWKLVRSQWSKPKLLSSHERVFSEKTVTKLILHERCSHANQSRA